ncbi:FAD-binding oxidoreductase [Labrenzia sp. R4_2]|uniref:NAD(P)/FAD-dependent oxidoreductase n=1 Tax=Labrenzia sp. R4_2 TaxID=2821107 RepID=UPI001ADA9CFE|nr:FAD-binding oxidoreductase [Labrenzia sp. R4_2]MBO9420768.1 FAD-binding oxidoreductase [Labrenzia sp. R4_2]
MTKTLAIIGAGIIGVSTAIWMQREGHKVILIDKAGPGEGASHGNGGVLASCSMIPVTVPGLILKAPGMLFSPNQPLFLKWRYLPKLLPWLAKYLGHANEKDVNRIAEAVHGIVGDSLAEHQALAEGTGAEHFIVPSDYLFLYRDRAHFEEDAFGWSIRAACGFRWEELEGEAVRAYDHGYSSDIGFAVKLGDHGRITDPGKYVKALAAHAKENGAQIVQAEVQRIEVDSDEGLSLKTNSGTIEADDILVATGAWSKPLAAQLGLDVPLESERGYHLELWEPNYLPKSPVMVASGKFVITPMDGRIRLAGVVEFGGLEAGASAAPIELLKQNIRAAMPDLTWEREVEWMGHRPAPADSIPAIGAVPGIKGAWLGFGHHHIGLTGGPKTGRLLAQMISGKRTNLDLSPYTATRFQ